MSTAKQIEKGIYQMYHYTITRVEVGSKGKKTIYKWVIGHNIKILLEWEQPKLLDSMRLVERLYKSDKWHAEIQNYQLQIEF